MTNKRYNMHNLDVRVRNINELNELEYGLFNTQAKEVAERFLGSVSQMSPDFQERAAKWITELDGQRKKVKRTEDKARDDQGRYSTNEDSRNPIFPDEGEPNPYNEMLGESEEDELVRLIQDYKARKQAAIDTSSAPTRQGSASEKPRQFGDNVNDFTLAPGMQWAMRDGKQVQIPRHGANKPRPEYAPGVGSGMPTSPLNSGVGNMAFVPVSPKRGNR